MLFFRRAVGDLEKLIYKCKIPLNSGIASVDQKMCCEDQSLWEVEFTSFSCQLLFEMQWRVFVNFFERFDKMRGVFKTAFKRNLIDIQVCGFQ